MTLLAAERIKLLSIRAPWWCAGIATIVSLGFTAMFVGVAGQQFPLHVSTTQLGGEVGRTVMLVLAVLTSAGEYNWRTIRTTFQSVPKRVPALVAKSCVVGAWCGLTGLLIGFGSWMLSTFLAPSADLALDDPAAWRAVAGQGLVFLFTGLLGVGLGLLLRSSAASIAVALIWTQLVEGLVALIPNIGTGIYHWMPFVAADQFLGITLLTDVSAGPFTLGEPPLTAAQYGAYFAAVSVVLVTVGIVVANRRDV